MRLVFRVASALVVVAIIVWSLFGFMAWQWDPEEWTKAGRGTAIFFWLALGIPAAMAGEV